MNGGGSPALAAPVSPGAEAPHAPLHDVVLLDPPAALERALRAALSPWGMRITSVARAAPTPTLPSAAVRARTLAAELNATALVWLSSNPDGSALWIYEASKGTVMARPIPSGPLDRALAAALALSVKTWLRHSDPAADAAEPADAALAPPARAPVATAAPPISARAVAPRGEGPPPSGEIARGQLVIHAAARRGAFEPTAFEPRYGLELRVSPWDVSGGVRSILAARVELGAAQSIRNSTFEGVYSEVVMGISLGLAQRIAEPLRVAFHAGATFHRGSVWGTLLPDRSSVDRAEWGAAVQLRPEAELAIGSLGVILQPTLGVSILGERYETDDEVLLETRQVWWMLGGALRASLF